MGNSPSVRKQYIDLLQGLLAGKGAKINHSTYKTLLQQLVVIANGFTLQAVRAELQGLV